MTSLHSALGMLILAGLLLALSAHCLGFSTRRLHRVALHLCLVAGLPGLALAQTSTTTGSSPLACHPAGMGMGMMGDPRPAH